MKISEVLTGLKKKQSAEVCLCIHPDHKAVVEIIAKSELDKWVETASGYEGSYEVVYTAQSRGEALDLVQNALLFAYQKDASLENSKGYIREFFAEIGKENPNQEE